LTMKNNTKIKLFSSAIATVFALSLSFSANAEEMSLEEAQAEISRLENENTSLKQELESYEKEIAAHRAKLEENDNMISELSGELEGE
jgi:peptidoglycan hydrolase CwlO-like protein